MQRREQAVVEVVPAQFEDGVFRRDLGLEHVVEHFTRIDAVVDVVERGTGEVQRLRRRGGLGRPIRNRQTTCAIQGVPGGIGTPALVRRFNTGNARMDVHDAAGKWRTGTHQLIQDHQQAVQHHDIGLQLHQRVMQAAFEILLAGDMFRAAPWQASISRRHAQQQVIDQAPLHAQVGRIQPLATRLVGKTVVGHQLLVAWVLLVVVIHHAHQVIGLAQRRVVQRPRQGFQHRHHVALMVLVGHRLPGLVGRGIAQGPHVHQILFRHCFALAG